MKIQRLHTVINVMIDQKLRTQFDSSLFNIMKYEDGYIVESSTETIFVPLSTVSYVVLEKVKVEDIVNSIKSNRKK